MIYTLIIASVLYLALRITRIVKAGRVKLTSSGTRLKLPIQFYVEQGLALTGLSLFLFALDPVPAYLAVAAVIGVFLDTMLTMYYYLTK
jgi:hypothetical protein